MAECSRTVLYQCIHAAVSCSISARPVHDLSWRSTSSARYSRVSPMNRTIPPPYEIVARFSNEYQLATKQIHASCKGATAYR
jgi:hypothetical protein